MNICRQCFREKSTDIGFNKVRLAFTVNDSNWHWRASGLDTCSRCLECDFPRETNAALYSTAKKQNRVALPLLRSIVAYYPFRWNDSKRRIHEFVHVPILSHGGSQKWVSEGHFGLAGCLD